MGYASTKAGDEKSKPSKVTSSTKDPALSLYTSFNPVHGFVGDMKGGHPQRIEKTTEKLLFWGVKEDTMRLKSQNPQQVTYA